VAAWARVSPINQTHSSPGRNMVFVCAACGLWIANCATNQLALCFRLVSSRATRLSFRNYLWISRVSLTPISIWTHSRQTSNSQRSCPIPPNSAPSPSHQSRPRSPNRSQLVVDGGKGLLFCNQRVQLTDLRRFVAFSKNEPKHKEKRGVQQTRVPSSPM